MITFFPQSVSKMAPFSDEMTLYRHEENNGNIYMRNLEVKFYNRAEYFS